MKRLSDSEESKKVLIIMQESKLSKLDEMAGDNQRSALIRKLIDQEWERRQAMKVKAEATNGSN